MAARDQSTAAAALFALHDGYYTCNICGVRENFCGIIPARHCGHSQFSLTCGFCGTELFRPRFAAEHLLRHMAPLELTVQTTPSVRRAPVLELPSLPPYDSDEESSVSSLHTIPETQSSQSRSPQVLESQTSSPLQPAQQPPAASSVLASPSAPSAAVTDELTRLRDQLSIITSHLVGITAATARLPPMDTAAISASPLTPAEVNFRHQLSTTFTSSMSNVHTLPAPLLARVLLPVYEQWFAEFASRS